MRRPADEQGPAPRQVIWEELRKSPEGVSARNVALQKGLIRKTVADYLMSLCRAGYVELTVSADLTIDGVYTLVQDVGVEAPRVRRDGSRIEPGSGTEAMWRTMLMMREFSIADVAAHATTGRCTVSEATAKTYLSVLLRAGYLMVVRKSQPRAGRHAIYRLIRRSGPRPPQIQRVKQVYDPNTCEVFGAEELA